MTGPSDITNWLPPPVSYGRERVAAIIEAATGCSPLGPCHLRVMREQRAHMVAMAEAALGIDIRATRTKKPRRPTLASVAKQASKAGIEVARYEVEPDKVVVVTGKSEPAEPENPWLAELRKKKTKK